jgi:hypothetical protein
MKINTSKTALAALASAVAIAVSGCIPMAGAGGGPGFGGPGFGGPGLGQQQQTPLPTFSVTTHTGSTETVRTSFTPGVGAPSGAVRICLNNQKPGNRSIDLNLQGVNPMVGNGRNTQSCVSVSASQTVNLLAGAGFQPAHISPGVIDLAPYEGGLLTLVWG